jgi:hypothetical protein
MSSGDYSVYARVDGDEKSDWFERANCKGTDTETFFVEKGEYYTDEPRKICQKCVVKSQCLTYAVKYRVQGYWAGTTEQERRALSMAKKINASAFKPH